MAACSVPKEKMSEETSGELAIENPAAKGFNIEDSDSKAISIADEVMNAMGGRTNWNNTRYITWNFFGSRKHLWDKWTGDVRIESLRSDLSISINIRSMEGQAMKGGLKVEHPDSLKELLQYGKSAWINDSYWLVMPFKLKDSGVTLKYLRNDTTLSGAQSDVLGLTFEAVGDTPNNGYEVWIDNESRLVTQWAFYRNASDTVAGFTLPWGDYLQKGSILLSGDRGEGERDLVDIEVLKSVPENIFADLSVPLP